MTKFLALTTFGVLFILAGIGVGFYVGIYLMLYWGIVDAIAAFSDPVNTSAGVWAIIRAVCFELGGSLAAILPLMIGTFLLALAADD